MLLNKAYIPACLAGIFGVCVAAVDARISKAQVQGHGGLDENSTQVNDNITVLTSKDGQDVQPLNWTNVSSRGQFQKDGHEKKHRKHKKPKAGNRFGHNSTWVHGEHAWNRSKSDARFDSDSGNRSQSNGLLDGDLMNATQSELPVDGDSSNQNQTDGSVDNDLGGASNITLDEEVLD